jgi:hypothetical protein
MRNSKVAGKRIEVPEEERAHAHEGDGPGLLVPVEARGDEGPDLVEHAGRGHEDAYEEGHLM